RVQGLGQLASRYLQVASGVAAGDGVRGQGGQLAAVAVQEGEAAQADVRVAQPWQEAHAFHDVERGAAHVDGVAAAAEGGGLLDDRDRVAGAVEPVGQGAAGDAGPGDQGRAPRCGAGAGRTVGAGHARTPLLMVRVTRRAIDVTTPARAKAVTSADSAATVDPGGVAAVRRAPPGCPPTA